MAYTTTTLSSAVTVTDTSIVVGSATSFAAGNRIFIDQEEMEVGQSYTTGTTIPVKRGIASATAAHASGAAVAQGIGAADFPATGQQAVYDKIRMTLQTNAVQVTATGATGSTAAALPAITPCLVAIAGTSGAGVAIPTGAAVPGAWYVVNHASTGAINVYAVGGTINGTTGTTAASITATGNASAVIFCVNAGAWLMKFNT
jgi:hypothetical protein